MRILRVHRNGSRRAAGHADHHADENRHRQLEHSHGKEAKDADDDRIDDLTVDESAEVSLQILPNVNIFSAFCGLFCFIGKEMRLRSIGTGLQCLQGRRPLFKQVS